MAASAPKTPDAAGSGMTIQKSSIDPAITKDVQSNFSTSMRDQNNNLSSLYNSALNAPSMSTIGQFSPESLNLQRSVSLQQAGPYSFSENLNPIVAGNLARTYQDASGQVNAMNSQIADRLGNNPANSALIASIQNQNRMQGGLTNNASRLAALGQQRDMDLQGFNLDLNRIAQNNQALLSQGQFANEAELNARAAAERVFQMNADATNANNSSALNAYNARQQAAQNAASLQQEYFKSLGQGLLSTAPQVQSNFTVDDIKELMNNPQLMDALLGTAGTAGLLSQDDISRLTGAAGGTLPSNVRPSYQNTAQDDWNRRRNEMVARNFGIS